MTQHETGWQMERAHLCVPLMLGAILAAVVVTSTVLALALTP